MTIWYVLLAILGLSVLVITHELGHYLMGKWLGFTITEFSVGLGPKLFGIKGKETEFTLRALPIGGSCRFFGEDGNDDGKDKQHPEAFEEDDEPKEEAPKEPDPRLFSSKPAWKRFLVVLAGPLMNILTCVLLCFVMLVGSGVLKEQSENEVLIVDTVFENGPAEKAGLQAGDVLLSMDGIALTDASKLDEALKNASMEGATVTVLRDANVEETQTTEGRLTTTTVAVSGGTVKTLSLGNLLDQTTGNKRMQIQFRHLPYEQVTERYSVWKAAYMAFPETWDMGKLVYQSLGMLISGQASCGDVTGVVGTVDFVSDAMAETQSTADAWELFLWFMALIAVNLGIINLLPLPALDGGRLVFIIIEMIRRKPVPPEKEGMVHLIGMVVLLLLMLALTVSDIIRCFH
ncbi:MAG: site-2 protease family protein [Clostridia bacterium]|nr:site-2 protease family protein [Clostridia bacterium]